MLLHAWWCLSHPDPVISTQVLHGGRIWKIGPAVINDKASFFFVFPPAWLGKNPRRNFFLTSAIRCHNLNLYIKPDPSFSPKSTRVLLGLCSAHFFCLGVVYESNVKTSPGTAQNSIENRCRYMLAISGPHSLSLSHIPPGATTICCIPFFPICSFSQTLQGLDPAITINFYFENGEKEKDLQNSNNADV